MSLGLVMFITIYGLINLVGGSVFHIICALNMDLDKACRNKQYNSFWGYVWESDLLRNINNSGKIIIEILYTITFLPLIICEYLLFSIVVICYFMIVKPFIFIFKKREQPNGEQSK